MSGKLTFRQKTAYGIGDMGFCLTTGMLGIIFLKFLTDYQGLNPVLAGLTIALARVWDGVSDPIMGYLADRTKTKMGSYRPYLLFGAVPFALSFLALWYIPDLSPMGKIVYYSVMYILFDTFLTVLFIPYVSLTTRITPDYDERTSITTFRMVFSLSATMLANVLPSMIIGPMRRVDEATGAVTLASRNSIWLVAGSIAIVTVTVFLITALGTREMEYQAPDKQKLGSITREALKNKPYLMAAGIYLMILVSFELLLGSVLYYFENCLGIYDTSIYLGIIFVFALISVPTLWNRLAARLDKVRAFIIGGMVLVLSSAVIMFLPKGTPLPAIYAVFAFAGIGLGAGQTLPWAIIPDTMDFAEHSTGFRNDALMYSLMTSARKVISAITPVIIGAGLSLGKYNPDLAVQPRSSILAIRFVFAGVPIFSIAFAILLAVRYPLSRKDSERISMELKTQRAEEAV